MPQASCVCCAARDVLVLHDALCVGYHSRMDKKHVPAQCPARGGVLLHIVKCSSMPPLANTLCSHPVLSYL
jgi:hypothetical protein